MLTVGELFAGIGGIGLGLEWTGGFEIRWQVEQDEFCRKVLAKHWPGVKRYGRVEDVGAHNLEPVDLICGGFPCQDISFAGTGIGLDGERSGLWAEFARVLGEVGPRFALVENVPALVQRGLSAVLGDLSNLGFDAEWSVVSACSVGAPHVRRRMFVVAYADGLDGRQGLRDSVARAFRPLQAIDGFQGSRARWGTRLENPSELYGGADGLPAGMDRNRAIGNAVVPQVAEWIGRRILEAAA